MGGTYASIQVSIITVDWDKDPPLDADDARASLRDAVERAAKEWHAANPGCLELEPMVW